MKFIYLLAFLIFSAFSFQTYATTTLPIMVKYLDGKAVNNVLGLKPRHLFATWHVYYPTKSGFNNTLNALKSNPDIIAVQVAKRSEKRELDKPSRQIFIEMDNFDRDIFNDSFLSRQWVMKDSTGFGSSIIKAYETYGSNPKSEIIVAVVDTGVDYKHEDLAANMWINKDEIAGNNIDDDGNGYADDIYGINTIIRDANNLPTSEIMDTHSHGTHVSGSIAAIQNNSKGIAGIASHAKIMGIRTVPNSGDELDVDVVESFIYAAKNGAKIINCSFGKAHNEGGLAVSEAIEYIGKTYGVLVVAAAGNDSKDIDKSPAYPASYQNETLLVVASNTNSQGNFSYFSNYGIKSVDVAAPGSSIYSTTPNNRYEYKSGTSMAAPNTAGVAAEILSHFPNLTPVELKKVIMNNTDFHSIISTKIGSKGIVNLDKSLENLYHSAL